MVLASDPVPANRVRALAFGATHSLPTGDELIAHLADLTDARGADVVFELAGRDESAQASPTFARTGGTVILAGTVAPTAPLRIDPEKIVRRMLTIRGVHNYHPRDLHAALMFLAGPGRGFAFESLVAAEFSLDAVESAFARAHASAGSRVAVVP